MSATVTVTGCGVCDQPTTNTADHNDYDDYILCDGCLTIRVWEEEHRPGECDDGPEGVECARDHDGELDAYWEELRCDMARDEGLL